MIITSNTTISKENVQKWIEEFKKDYQPQLIELGQYYDGTNPVKKEGVVADRSHYSLNVNLASYITDVQTSYFMGIPPTYEFEEKSAIESKKDTIFEILSRNDEQSHNFDIANDSSCYGVAYELLMLLKDTNKNAVERISLSRLNPEQTFIVYNDEMPQKQVCAICFINSTDEKIKVYVYTDKEIIEFSGKTLKELSLGDITQHNFGNIPVVAYNNNTDLVGDYAKVKDLLNTISVSVSGNADDLQSVANSFLAIFGAGGTDEKDVELINSTRVANLPTGTDMKFVVKDVPVEAIKYQIEQALDFVYQISKTPDLTDEAFGGNQSGVAMQFKLWGIEQNRMAKERAFKKSLLTRLSMIVNTINLAENSQYEVKDQTKITFYKNLPQNDEATYSMVEKLSGVVSLKTLLEQIPFIDDVEEEYKQVQEEKKESFNMFDIQPNDKTTENEE